MPRIYKNHQNIDRSSIWQFFEHRGHSINTDHPLTSILYQDSNPDLAVKRDRFEKDRIQPLLNLTTQDVVLDIGCGIGRWAERVAPLVAAYHGTDFCNSLIAAATAGVTLLNVSFQALPAEQTSPETVSLKRQFTRVIIAGLLLYLNDDDIVRTLRGASRCCGEGALIYVREPIAIADRLTLDRHWSEELGATYSAIYRTGAELEALFAESLLAEGFQLIRSEPLYPSQFNNRTETRQHFYLCRRS